MKIQFLPSEKHVLSTPFSKKRVEKVMEERVQQVRWFDFFKVARRTFRGEINDSSFSIARVRKNKKSMMSIMDGEISDNTGKTTLFITLRLHRFVAAFYLLWMISVGSIGGVGLIGSALNGHFEGLFIIPVLMFLFGLFLINFAFKTEKKITLEVFKKMLEIEEDSIDNNSPIQRL